MTDNFAGNDIKVVIKESGVETIVSAETFSFKKKEKDGEMKTTGKVKFLLFGEPKNLINKEARLVVTTINGDGVFSTLFDEDVFFNSVSLSVDVKKAISIENYTFTDGQED